MIAHDDFLHIESKSDRLGEAYAHDKKIIALKNKNTKREEKIKKKREEIEELQRQINLANEKIQKERNRIELKTNRDLLRFSNQLLKNNREVEEILESHFTNDIHNIIHSYLPQHYLIQARYRLTDKYGGVHFSSDDQQSKETLLKLHKKYSMKSDNTKPSIFNLDCMPQSSITFKTTCPWICVDGHEAQDKVLLCLTFERYNIAKYNKIGYSIKVLNCMPY